jgi:hypothetical protein
MEFYFRQSGELKDRASRGRGAARQSLVLDFVGLPKSRSAMRIDGHLCSL